jgi:hypothetical protein
VGIASAVSLLDVRNGVGSIVTLGNTGNFEAGEFSRIKWQEGSTQLADIGWEANTNELRINNRVASTSFYAANAEGMRLDSTGLGIGTSSPAQKLAISSADTDRTAINLVNTSSGGGNFNIGAVGSAGWLGGSAGSLLIRDSNAGVTRVVLNSTGNVGIGTTSPSARLHSVTSSDTPLIAESTGGSAYVIVQNSSATAGAGIASTGNNLILFTSTSGTERARIDSSGNFLVAKSAASSSTVGWECRPNGEFSSTMSATTDATVTSYVYSTGAGAARFYVGMGGTVFATSIVITAISDQRLKENVRDLDTGLNSIMALQPRRFDWKEGKGQDKKDVAGFIAQEFENVFPECVSTSKAGADGIEYKNINHETLIPTLVKAMQEQQALITQLQADVATLKGN